MVGSAVEAMVSEMQREDFDLASQAAALLIGCLGILLLFHFAMDRDEEEVRWDLLLRPLMIVVGLAAFLTPLLFGAFPPLANLVLFTCYLCTSAALWVASLAGIFVCTGFFSWLLAQVPLVDLPLAQIAKNAGLMFFGFFPRTAAAALVLALYWGATLLYLPATILTILAFGFWLPVTIALMIVYPGLEKVFKLEETINARRAAEIEERMAQNEPKFDQ